MSTYHLSRYLSRVILLLTCTTATRPVVKIPQNKQTSAELPLIRSEQGCDKKLKHDYAVVKGLSSFSNFSARPHHVNRSPPTRVWSPPLRNLNSQHAEIFPACLGCHHARRTKSTKMFRRTFLVLFKSLYQQWGYSRCPESSSAFAGACPS